MTPRGGRAIAAVGAVACLAGAVWLHAAQEYWVPAQVDRPELLYVRSPAVLKRAALGYDAIAADVYWIRALQHFGEERLSPPSHTRSYSLLSIEQSLNGPTVTLAAAHVSRLSSMNTASRKTSISSAPISMVTARFALAFRKKRWAHSSEREIRECHCSALCGPISTVFARYLKWMANR